MVDAISMARKLMGVAISMERKLMVDAISMERKLMVVPSRSSRAPCTCPGRAISMHSEQSACNYRVEVAELHARDPYEH